LLRGGSSPTPVAGQLRHFWRFCHYGMRLLAEVMQRVRQQSGCDEIAELRRQRSVVLTGRLAF
jgi:hypothetical protein